MFSAISGLQVHQTMLDVAANDIANVNTVGFKGESTTFKDALSQLQRGAAGPSTGLGGTNAIQIGLGVALGGIGNDMGAGAMQQTGNPLDLAIQGDGFFRVGPSSVIGSGAGYSYTRAGNFGLDSAGNLVTADGSFVIGYKYDSGTATFPVSTDSIAAAMTFWAARASAALPSIWSGGTPSVICVKKVWIRSRNVSLNSR